MEKGSKLKAKGTVIRKTGNGVLVSVGNRKYLLGYGAYLIWRAFKEDSEPWEVVSQAVVLSGMSKEEAERLILPFIDEMIKRGLLE